MSDDDNWEVYVPQVGERYARGGQHRIRASVGHWFDKTPNTVFDPCSDTYEYRRPKQKAEEPVSEPAAQPSEYEARVTQMTVTHRGKPTYDESETTITIEDEGGGEFLAIHQSETTEGVRISVGEWMMLRSTIEVMIQNCRAGE